MQYLYSALIISLIKINKRLIARGKNRLTARNKIMEKINKYNYVYKIERARIELKANYYQSL